MWNEMLAQIAAQNMRALARGISFVENEQPGYEDMMQALPANEHVKIIGITGPPGAGKSTLVDALIGRIVQEQKKVAVLCVDPSSPFHLGALLGDRIRMSHWYLNDQVFIRSLATRGSMGGLHPHIVEITELCKAAGYDHIIVETVGVGQSEIEIAGLADTTVVVMVPEAGDEVQVMKAGLMEIADIFVLNKSDRPEADRFIKHLRQMLAPAFQKANIEIPILKTVATAGVGIDELYQSIIAHEALVSDQERKLWLLTERAWYLIQQGRMRGITKQELRTALEKHSGQSFNLYRFIQPYIHA